MKIFITDGSVEGFYAAVFDAYFETDCIISSDRHIQLALDNQVVNVEKNSEKFLRIQNSINRYDKYAEDDILLALRSNDLHKEQTAFNYIRKLFQTKSPIRKMLSLQEVIELNNILYKVRGEIHRLKGLLRFMENADGILYAPYTPDNNITDVLMRHFAERLKNQRFVIHDLKRKIAGMYNGINWGICYVDEVQIFLSEHEKDYENLWKKYYSAVNIKERPHEKQMKGSMPIRYWKFLPEKQND